jgi:hypothetical protein
LRPHFLPGRQNRPEVLTAAADCAGPTAAVKQSGPAWRLTLRRGFQAGQAFIPDFGRAGTEAAQITMSAGRLLRPAGRLNGIFCCTENAISAWCFYLYMQKWHFIVLFRPALNPRALFHRNGKQFFHVEGLHHAL